MSNKSRDTGFGHFWEGVQILQGIVEIPPHREEEFFRCPKCESLRLIAVAAMPCLKCEERTMSSPNTVRLRELQLEIQDQGDANVALANALPDRK